MQPLAEPQFSRLPAFRPAPEMDRCRQAVELLSKAQRPMIVAGGGVHLSAAHEAMASLQEIASLPVATTSMGKGAVAETHALSLGVIGYFMGTRGMAASRFPALLAMVEAGRIDVARLITRRIALAEAGAAIAAMDGYAGSGITVIDRF